MTRINAAAVRGKSYFSDKEMIWSVTPPGRHCDLMSAAAMRRANADHARAGAIDNERYAGAEPEPLEQGFVTSDGRFVDREEAWRIAVDAGQVTEVAQTSRRELFSEDLW